MNQDILRMNTKRSEIQSILDILHKWGIHTLGQLAALDKDQLGARLGTEGVRLWERANGKSTRLLKFVQPSESFAETFEFENEIETVEPLLFMLQRFLQQLSLRLGALYFVAKELRFQITFSDKSSYEHRFKIPAPTRSVEILFRMLHTHLENFKSEFPITAVTLDAQATKPAHQQFGLFETALRDPAQLSETLARLTGLLGSNRVGRPVLENTHRPGAFHLEPFSWQLDESLFLEEPLPACALRCFRPATSASVLLTENKPAHFRSAEIDGAIQDGNGPYNSSGDWWDEKSWVRGEWDLQLENGALCRCYEHEGVWKLDGIYD
jgi:protein ImuB